MALPERKRSQTKFRKCLTWLNRINPIKLDTDVCSKRERESLVGRTRNSVAPANDFIAPRGAQLPCQHRPLSDSTSGNLGEYFFDRRDWFWENWSSGGLSKVRVLTFLSFLLLFLSLSFHTLILFISQTNYPLNNRLAVLKYEQARWDSLTWIA